jgi:hypothetical protein
MSTGSKSGVSKHVGFKLESEEKRQQLEMIRIQEGYSNLTAFMRDLVDEKIEESDLPG